MPNHLKNSSSPYLLQHAENPVDWYPWGEEAFAKAKKENKPIFLSIGYSTCHWCHVMAHESFEDEEVAKLMNEAFVSIKVDREERPDIDQVYIKVAQLMSGQAGWPLTIIMTPDKKPFFSGTYFPKDSRFGSVGMLDLIPEIQQAWQEEQGRIAQTSRSLEQALQQIGKKERESDQDMLLTVADLDQAYEEYAHRFDDVNGGFSELPKFPTPHIMLFLLKYYQRSKNEHALEMVEKTLEQIRFGGIFDQLGGGIHRYAVDKEWLVPHFEKMLYDQALLILACSEAYSVTKKEFYKDFAGEIINYVLTDLKDEGGAFWAGEDADSEGVEGKFYVWTETEIRELLDSKEVDFAIKIFGIEPDGNFQDEALQKKTGQNILHLSSWPKDQKELNKVRDTLLAARSKRVRPHRDDKVLTDWNGLMIAALARAGAAFKKFQIH